MAPVNWNLLKNTLLTNAYANNIQQFVLKKTINWKFLQSSHYCNTSKPKQYHQNYLVLTNVAKCNKKLSPYLNLPIRYQPEKGQNTTYKSNNIFKHLISVLYRAYDIIKHDLCSDWINFIVVIQNNMTLWFFKLYNEKEKKNWNC